MDPKTTNDSTRSEPSEHGGRRRRRETNANMRYFLLKPGSTADKPELGQEVASEGEALVNAFKSGQVFLTVVPWKAVPELTDDDPRIVKQALTRS